ncbi:MFS general substrate transporter [Durotheca rogersii]|uniref:MFS general substrate transporter n=1 Tax=Durotheca rogersii TaxID=419775 RepID=UPI00222037CD|nr:MFS general substrate transporter [Durotheca rogersii]KAI5860237.1 MFS general substrate transporter [Durotheca rogersii]
MPSPPRAEASGSSLDPGKPKSATAAEYGENDAAEDTPLLRSGSSSLRAGSVSIASASEYGREQDDATDSLDLDTPNQTVSRGRAVAIVLSVYLLIFLIASNMSGITMAQSMIAADLDAYDEAVWFAAAFLVAMSSSTPVAGKLASVFSPRAVALAASALFATGCAATARAPSFAAFVTGRALSGVGAGGVTVLAVVLILELASKRQRGLFFGLLNAGFTTGVSLGAVVFGGLISVTGWRVLFWIQTPLSLVAGLGIYLSVPSSFSSSQILKEERATLATKLKRIDYLGGLFLSATVILFLFGLSGSIRVVPLVVSSGTLALFVLIEYYVAVDPIIPIAVLQNRGALLLCISQLGFMAARWTVLFYAPITALAVRGFAPAASGSMLIPTNLGFGMGGLLVGWLHVRHTGSFWLSCLVSLALFAASLFVLSLISTADAPLALYVAAVFANGLFTGAGLNYTLAHLLHLTPPETHYVATSLLGTFRGFAGSFGSAIGGGIFARTLRAALESGFGALDGHGGSGGPPPPDRAELIRKLVGSPALVFHGGLADAERAVAVSGYVDALRVLFQAAVVLSLGVLVIQAATGWKAGTSDKAKIDRDEASVLGGDAERDREAEGRQ